MLQFYHKFHFWLCSSGRREEDIEITSSPRVTKGRSRKQEQQQFRLIYEVSSPPKHAKLNKRSWQNSC